MESYFGLFTVIESQIEKASAATLETRLESMKKNNQITFFCLMIPDLFTAPQGRTVRFLPVKHSSNAAHDYIF